MIYVTDFVLNPVLFYTGILKFTDMKKNMGTVDKIVRTLIVLVLIVLYAKGILAGTLGIILLVVAGILLITSLVGFCPLYALLGIRTLRKTESNG